MALDGWGEVCATKEESKICFTCPIAAVFCDSANVAEISNPSMAKTAVAFCVLRSRQIGKPVTAEALADQMAKLYKPHRDKQNISSQLDSIGYDLKEIREDADKSDAQTKTEIEWQIRRMLLLGLSCLQLGGSISLSPTVAEPTVGQAISY